MLDMLFMLMGLFSLMLSGDKDLLIHRPWDGSGKKGASFTVADDGSVIGFSIMGTAPASPKQ